MLKLWGGGCAQRFGALPTNAKLARVKRYDILISLLLGSARRLERRVENLVKRGIIYSARSPLASASARMNLTCCEPSP